MSVRVGWRGGRRMPVPRRPVSRWAALRRGVHPPQGRVRVSSQLDRSPPSRPAPGPRRPPASGTRVRSASRTMNSCSCDTAAGTRPASACFFACSSRLSSCFSPAAETSPESASRAVSVVSVGERRRRREGQRLRGGRARRCPRRRHDERVAHRAASRQSAIGSSPGTAAPSSVAVTVCDAGRRVGRDPGDVAGVADRCRLGHALERDGGSGLVDPDDELAAPPTRCRRCPSPGRARWSCPRRRR